MKKILLYAVVLLLYCSLSSSTCSCNKEKNGIQQLVVENYSGREMFFWYSYKFPKHHYPDTFLPPIIPTADTPYSEIRGAGKGDGGGVGGRMGVYPNSWPIVFSKLPDGYFSVYFFEMRPKTQVQWDSIRNNMTRVYRKDVSYEELKNNNFTMRYPF